MRTDATQRRVPEWIRVAGTGGAGLDHGHPPSREPESPQNTDCGAKELLFKKLMYFPKDYSEKEKEQERSVPTASQAGFSALYFCIFLREGTQAPEPGRLESHSRVASELSAPQCGSRGTPRHSLSGRTEPPPSGTRPGKWTSQHLRLRGQVQAGALAASPTGGLSKVARGKDLDRSIHGKCTEPDARAEHRTGLNRREFRIPGHP